MVGYTPTHWIIKNSWGTNWGDSGFGYLSKKADCGLKLYIDAMEVDFGFAINNSTNSANNQSNIKL